MTANPKPNELHLTRMFDAPLAMVWDAWTDPDKVAQWWGPRGFTITTHSRDLKTGGHWNYTMHGPDGTDYPNTTKYLEVSKPSKLVYDHGGSDDRPPMFRVTVLFTEVGKRTKMDMTMTLETPEAAEETRKFIRKAGGDATWDRLAEYLGQAASGKETFVINRSCSAPRTLVFDAWTDPKLLAQWLPPAGFSMEFVRADIRSGGGSFYYMTNGSAKMYGRAEYVSVEKPDRVVYRQQFCDEHEKIARHPFAPTWPETMLTTVTFAEEGPQRTRITVTWEIHGTATPEELATFTGMKGSMTQGWTGSMDKLEAWLEQKRAAA